MVKAWLGLGTKRTWLRLGKDHGHGSKKPKMTKCNAKAGVPLSMSQSQLSTPTQEVLLKCDNNSYYSPEKSFSAMSRPNILCPDCTDPIPVHSVFPNFKFVYITT